MAGAEVRRSGEQMAEMGALLVIRGGESCLSLSGSSGGFRWTAGGPVRVWKGLDWALEARFGR